MERRLLLAILLTFLVLTVYQWMLPKPPPQPPQATGGATGAPSSGATGPGAAGSGSTQAGATPAPAPQVQLPPVETVVADTAEKTVTVDNGVVHAVFSNRGGTLLNWQLVALDPKT